MTYKVGKTSYAPGCLTKLMPIETDAASSAEPVPGYCAAPWLEAVIRIDGAVLPCCRTNYALGSTETHSLREIWASGAAVRLRAEISAGRYATPDCAHCHRDGTHTTLQKDLIATVGRAWLDYSAACTALGVQPNARLCGAMSAFRRHTLSATENGGPAAEPRDLVGAIFACRREPASVQARSALRVLRKVARASHDFIAQRLRPRLVATMRQVNLVAVCNARCVHCVGLYTGDIVVGQEVDGRRHKRMEADRVASALACRRDVTSFFMNGSEFLLHRNWQDLVEDFARESVSLSLSTNGMLLTPEVAAFLVSKRVLASANISFDGATRETIEGVRKGVRHDVLLAHTNGFLAALAASPQALSVSISMVLLMQNVAEAAGLVQLAHDMRIAHGVAVHVTFQPLTAAENVDYQRFFGEQRIEIDDPRHRPHLMAAESLGRTLGIATYYGYGGTLAAALGLVIPAVPALPAPTRKRRFPVWPLVTRLFAS